VRFQCERALGREAGCWRDDPRRGRGQGEWATIVDGHDRRPGGVALAAAREDLAHGLPDRGHQGPRHPGPGCDPAAQVFADNHWEPRAETWLGWTQGELGVRGPQPEKLCHIFTERPVYRPEDTVHIKGYLRERAKGHLASSTSRASSW